MRKDSERSVRRRERLISTRVFTGMVAAVFPALILFGGGCLDADPIGPGGGDTRLVIEAIVPPGAGGAGGAAKTAESDSLYVAIYDVTDDPYTATPELFPLAAEGGSFPSYEDETGRYFLADLRVDLIDRREVRIVTRLTYGSGAASETLAGERTITVAPGDRKRVTLVMADAEEPAGGEYGLALGRSVAAAGARSHGIPVILKNGDAVGGLQVQIRFDRAALDSVTGVEVDRSSRLYTAADEDSLIGTRLAQPTDSTFRVLTVDLRAVEGEGGDPPRAIPPGNDLLFFIDVNVAGTFPSLPDTVHLLLEEVFFSTPSGSTDIAVTEITDGFLIITE